MSENARRENRIQGIVDRVSSEDNFDDIKWITQAPVQTFCRSAVDETAQKNAALHNDLGIKATIRRQTVGENCKWCDALAGTYDYEDVKGTGNDVFRRHDDCDCVVEYRPGDGTAQDVWTKEWKEPAEDIEARKTVSERDNLVEQAREIYMSENAEKLGYEEADYRFRSLISSNSDAQLRKYIKKRRAEHSAEIPKPKTTGKKLEKEIDKKASKLSAREQLEQEAHNIYIAENGDKLGLAEAEYRFKSLISGNTDAQLRKYIQKAKKRANR